MDTQQAFKAITSSNQILTVCKQLAAKKSFWMVKDICVTTGYPLHIVKKEVNNLAKQGQIVLIQKDFENYSRIFIGLPEFRPANSALISAIPPNYIDIEAQPKRKTKEHIVHPTASIADRFVQSRKTNKLRPVELPEPTTLRNGQYKLVDLIPWAVKRKIDEGRFSSKSNSQDAFANHCYRIVFLLDNMLASKATAYHLEKLYNHYICEGKDRKTAMSAVSNCKIMLREAVALGARKSVPEWKPPQKGKKVRFKPRTVGEEIPRGIIPPIEEVLEVNPPMPIIEPPVQVEAPIVIEEEVPNISEEAKPTEPSDQVIIKFKPRRGFFRCLFNWLSNGAWK